jgi:glycosyltransferase involved in cell wall biosynthesis
MKAQNRVEYSIVFPFHNEQENLPFLIEDAIKFVLNVGKKCEFIFIDDNSSDNSLETVMSSLEQRNPSVGNLEVAFLKNDKNLGCHASVNHGLEIASGKYLLWFPTDRQILPTSAIPLLNDLKRNRILHTVRAKRRDPIYRKILGITWNYYTNLLLGLDIKDVDSVTFYESEAFRLISREIDTNGFIAQNTAQSLEMFVVAKQLGIPITQRKILHEKRYSGESKAITFKEVVNSSIDVLRIRKKYLK